jgi:hypoxanthine phosphoribosyltransferase
MNKKIYLSWEDINELLDKIHEQVKDSILYVSGLPRGGTILAIMYSHRFGVKYIHNMRNNYVNLLILDDIVDSGETLLDLRKTMLDPLIATLHYKSTSKAKPDYYAQELQNDGWIVYPWEKKDSKEIQDYLDI